MIKIVQAKPAGGTRIGLLFSDGTAGEFDLAPLIARGTELTLPLADEAFRSRFFLELGALCWPNGLELSAASVHRRLLEAGTLQAAQVA